MRGATGGGVSVSAAGYSVPGSSQGVVNQQVL